MAAGICQWGVTAAAQTGTPAAEPPIPVVEVAAVRDVDEMPYRKIFKGMEVFEQHRQMAPAAALRFRLYPRAKNASFEGLALTLTGDKTSIPVKIEDDHTFELPKNPDLVRDNVFVATNKKAGTYAWRVDIRTPGLPPSTRRLGDLRLECKVDMKGAELRQMVRDPSIMALVAIGDPCTFRTFTNPFFADRPVFNVTLVAGTRRESIASEWMYNNSARAFPEAVYELTDWRYARDRQYVPPIADSSWPDDTLLYFEYFDDPAPADAPAAHQEPQS